jgi:hypothetical protein
VIKQTNKQTETNKVTDLSRKGPGFNTSWKAKLDNLYLRNLDANQNFRYHPMRCGILRKFWK